MKSQINITGPCSKGGSKKGNPMHKSDLQKTIEALCYAGMADKAPDDLSLVSMEELKELKQSEQELGKWTSEDCTNGNAIPKEISGTNKEPDDMVLISRRDLKKIWDTFNFLDVVKCAHQNRNAPSAWMYLSVADQALRYGPNLKEIEELLK